MPHAMCTVTTHTTEDRDNRLWDQTHEAQSQPHCDQDLKIRLAQQFFRGHTACNRPKSQCDDPG